MRILICGSRNWKEEDVLPEYRIETYVKALPPNTVIIHGAAPGADMLADRFAKKYGHTPLPFKAEWDLYGNAAGPIRNQEMLDIGKPDRVVAFHEDINNSKGTRDMIDRARKARFPIEVFNGVPILRFVLLDNIGDFNSPIDACCGDCGRRVHAGIRQLDDSDPVYYSVCPRCGSTFAAPPDDYEEGFYRYFPE